MLLTNGESENANPAESNAQLRFVALVFPSSVERCDAVLATYLAAWWATSIRMAEHYSIRYMVGRRHLFGVWKYSAVNIIESS